MVRKGSIGYEADYYLKKYGEITEILYSHENTESLFPTDETRDSKYRPRKKSKIEKDTDETTQQNP